MRWAGYDESHNQWARRSVLEEDVTVLVLPHDVDPSIFVSRKSAPKRATKGPPDLLQPLYVALGVPLELHCSTVNG